MKKCHFCAEEIQDDAIKCRFCGEFLMQDMEHRHKKKPKWYYKTSSLFMGFIFVGPFILPVIWCNPKYSQRKKIVLTIVITMISIFLLKAVITSLGNISQYYKILQGAY